MLESIEGMNSGRITVHADADLKDLISQFLEGWREETKSMRDALEKGTMKRFEHSAIT